MASSSTQDLFTCAICLDLLRDPVTLHCGHNYCMGCIKGCWDQEDQKGVYSCPQCRQTFTPRPVLHKNTVFAELVEQFRKTRIQDPVSAQCVAGSGDVPCDVCTGRKLKAIRSCLDCLLSYCETHFKAHNDLNPGRKHSVVDATGQLQERICSRHKKVFEIFCRTDRSFICYLCTMDKHKGHDTVTAVTEWTSKKKQLGETQRRCQQKIQEKEKELQELSKAVEILKISAQRAEKDSDRIFAEMIRFIEERRSEVTQLIRAQKIAEVSRAEGVLKRLEQEIAELKRRDAELEQLSHIEDHIQFLKSVLSVTSAPCRTVSASMTFNQNISFEAVKESVLAVKVQMEEKLKQIFKQEESKISAEVMNVHIIRSLEYTDPDLTVRRTNGKERLPPLMPKVQAVSSYPVTRDDFLQYYCHFTLDPNTAAYGFLHLSEGNRRMDWGEERWSYPDNPERFDGWGQVLCREGVSGRCYWEVECRGQVYIAVSYKSISRKGYDDGYVFGHNDMSWALSLYYQNLCSASVMHSGEGIHCEVTSFRIGVYVDHRAGTLAFYNISDTMSLVHRVQTTFTHTLYPGFLIEQDGSSVKLL